jgi:hypothetical protein
VEKEVARDLSLETFIYYKISLTVFPQLSFKLCVGGAAILPHPTALRHRLYQEQSLGQLSHFDQ